MTNIKSFLAIAIIVLFAVACTDENDLGSAYINSNRLKTNTTNSNYVRKYYQYDSNNYNDEEMIQIIEEFDSLMNYGKTSIANYDIYKSVFAMEMFFNYAIVDKQEVFDTTKSYEHKIFEFTIDLENENTINPIKLREKYHSFLNNVLSSMGNMYLQFSDIYVENITSSSITFRLYIPEFNPILYVNRPHFTVRRVKPLNTVINNINVSSIWGHRIPRHTTEFNVYFYTTEFVQGLYTNTYAASSPDITRFAFWSWNRRYSNDTTMYISQSIYQNEIIPKTLIALRDFQNQNQGLAGKVYLDYDPVYDWDYTAPENYTGNNDRVTHFMLLRSFFVGNIIDPFNCSQYNHLCTVVSRLSFIQ
ncbi:MAG: hypothetical protein WC679_09220 [Bacteroidales bacterium]|jgi:hypothetical protein